MRRKKYNKKSFNFIYLKEKKLLILVYCYFLDILRYISSLNYEEPLNVKSWALKMFDATGKTLPGSSLQGAFIDMPGNVDSCLEVGNINYNFVFSKICLVSSIIYNKKR